MGAEYNMEHKFLVFSSKFLEKCTVRCFRALKTQNSKLKTNPGFTLLLAALVGSIVLALGSAVFGIALKQVTLSSIGRNSQFAFYAADTAAECALFWDFRIDIPSHKDIFATSSDSATPGSVTCDGKTADLDYLSEPGTTNPDVDAATTTFMYDITASGGKKYCAIVSVAKFSNNTVIRSNGYSNACADIYDAPDTLERAVQLSY